MNMNEIRIGSLGVLNYTTTCSSCLISILLPSLNDGQGEILMRTIGCPTPVSDLNLGKGLFTPTLLTKARFFLGCDKRRFSLSL